MIRSKQNRILGFLLAGILGWASGLGAQTTRDDENPAPQGYELSSDDVILIGTIRVLEHGSNGYRQVILHDEARGDIELLLNRGLAQAVDESPAESFEVEGLLVGRQMTVRELRPIE